MSDSYQQLLAATIQHLESLQTQGVRFVPVDPALVAELATGPRVMNRAPAAEPGVAFAPSLVAEPELRLAPALAAERVLRTDTKPSPQIETSAPLSSEAKKLAFEGLRQRVAACVRCPRLAASRKNTVFGVGSIDAELMFVGEAPGADEDAQGEPFVGKAGQLLTKIIQTMGLRRESVYIGNILKCRPDTPGQATGNRKPTPEEMQTCIPFLHEQIDLIRPKVLVALGATAVEGLLGKTEGITRLRGNWRTYRGIPLMPTYHPAYLLRNQSMAEKRRVWEDMLQVMEKLALPISEKQRGYFR